MGLYNSKEDFEKIKESVTWLTDDSWVHYYRSLINEKEQEFLKDDAPFLFKFGTMGEQNTTTLHDTLRQLFKYQSLDKFLESNQNPHLLSAEKQKEQEMILLTFMFPDSKVVCTRVMPEDGDLRNYGSIYKYSVNEYDIKINRNHGVFVFKKAHGEDTIIKKVISFDIDGTLGKQEKTIKIEDKDSYDWNNRVPISDEYGDFIFFLGAIDLLQKLKNETIILNTGGFRSFDSVSDRNELIRQYISNILNKQIQLYGVTYQTFDKKDIESALHEKIDNTEWQKWFNNLFKLHPASELHQVELPEGETLPSFFVRDHKLILDRHPELYAGLEGKLSNIFHLDDTPSSVVTLSKDCGRVSLFTMPRSAAGTSGGA